MADENYNTLRPLTPIKTKSKGKSALPLPDQFAGCRVMSSMKRDRNESLQGLDQQSDDSPREDENPMIDPNRNITLEAGF